MARSSELQEKAIFALVDHLIGESVGRRPKSEVEMVGDRRSTPSPLNITLTYYILCMFDVFWSRISSSLIRHKPHSPSSGTKSSKCRFIPREADYAFPIPKDIGIRNACAIETSTEG